MHGALADGGPVTALPRDDLVLAQLQGQVELPEEELLVIGEVIPEQRK